MVSIIIVITLWNTFSKKYVKKSQNHPKNIAEMDIGENLKIYLGSYPDPIRYPLPMLEIYITIIRIITPNISNSIIDSTYPVPLESSSDNDTYVK